MAWPVNRPTACARPVPARCSSLKTWQLVARLLRLKVDPALLQQYRNAGLASARRYDRAHLGQRMLVLLEAVAQKP